MSLDMGGVYWEGFSVSYTTFNLYHNNGDYLYLNIKSEIAMYIKHQVVAVFWMVG